ncbi:S8 family serine peptidase, partial [bacterium]|nr:S8 family serine peptidase [candidate division CSSED10-310 bacterium]
MRNFCCFRIFFLVIGIFFLTAWFASYSLAADRQATFWPDNNLPPFSTVTDSEATGVIRVLTADFDPLKTLPDLPAELKYTNEPNAITYHIVQFNKPITEKDKLLLAKSGAEPLIYLPHFAFIVRTAPNFDVDRVRSIPQIRWIGPFHPAYKIDPMTGRMPLSLPKRVNDSKYTLFVSFFPDESPDKFSAFVTSLGGEISSLVTGKHRNLAEIRLDPSRVLDLSRYQGVLRIEEKGECFINNDETQEVVQSGSVAGGTPIWNHSIHGENQIIGIMDSGVDPDHCFFYDNTQSFPGSTPNYSHRKIVAYRAYGSGVIYDGCTGGHGTHVAGTALGYPRNGSTNVSYCGIAYNAKATVGDIGQDDSSDCYYGYVYPPSSLISAFQDALNDGAYIHTNSWGGQTNSYESYAEDCDDFMWDHKNFLVLVAAGNTGPSSGTVCYPATAKNIMCVGGSDNEPNQEDMYYYSSRGPVSGSSRLAPHLTAPATDTSMSPDGIHSSSSDGDTSGETCGIIYANYSGTSMASPAVAGCAALVRQYYTEGFYPSGTANAPDAFTPTAALMKATLINSATNMSGTTVRPSNDQGWGRVLLDDTLYFPGDAAELYVVDNTTGAQTGSMFTYNIDVDSNAVPLKVTLVWTDRSGNNLVNDLDLELTNGSSTWYGNNFTSGWSNTGTAKDHTNTFECIYLNSGTFTPGTYTVRVRGYNVPQGEPGTNRQPFAVVVSASTGTVNTP